MGYAVKLQKGGPSKYFDVFWTIVDHNYYNTMPEVIDPTKQYSEFTVPVYGYYSSATTASWLIFSTAQLRKAKDAYISATLNINNAYARAYIYRATRTGVQGTQLSITQIADLIGGPSGSATYGGNLNENNRLYNAASSYPNVQIAVMTFGRAGNTKYSGILGVKG